MANKGISLEELSDEIHERLLRNPVKKLQLEISPNGRRYKINRQVGGHTGQQKGALATAATMETIRRNILPCIPLHYTASTQFGPKREMYLTVIPKPYS